jgi:hypothetical protein
MAEGRKKAVSLRVSAADLRKVKKLAQRLGVRDSDVIRFALKTTLARLAPLCDISVRGRSLLQVFTEAGTDLFHHFDLDTARLEEIVNGGATKEQEVSADDLQLIAMAGIRQTYGKLTLVGVKPVPEGERSAVRTEDAFGSRPRGHLDAKYAGKDPASDAAND